MIKEFGLKELTDLGLETEELKVLLAENLSYAIVVRGNLIQISNLKKAVEALGLFVCYQKISSNRLYITNWLPEAEG